MTAGSAIHAPSSPHAPLAHSESSLQPRHALSSQIGAPISQSAGVTHCTQEPVMESQTIWSGNRAHSAESVQPSHTSVVPLQTGAADAQPFFEQLGTTHWLSTHASPAVQLRGSPSMPACVQSARSRQQTAGFGFVHATTAATIVVYNRDFIPRLPAIDDANERGRGECECEKCAMRRLSAGISRSCVEARGAGPKLDMPRAETRMVMWPPARSSNRRSPTP